METTNLNQLIIGLPRTGKTTFLAAMWHILNCQEILPDLELKELFGDDEHLNEIRRRWLSCNEIERTKLSSDPKVTMRLASRDGGVEVDVVFPDMDGETFSQQWETRQWSTEYSTFARTCTGALLFVHPDKVDRPTTILEVLAAVNQLPETAPTPKEEAVGTTLSTVQERAPVVEWDPKTAPTQTKLVDILQFIVQHAISEFPFRLAVVVSAWDKLRGMGKTPVEWLQLELPLLSQFIQSNPEVLEYQVFGVSAQGGDLPSDFEGLANYVRHAERIEIVGINTRPHDLTSIVKWAMGER